MAIGKVRASNARQNSSRACPIAETPASSLARAVVFLCPSIYQDSDPGSAPGRQALRLGTSLTHVPSAHRPKYAVANPERTSLPLLPLQTHGGKSISSVDCGRPTADSERPNELICDVRPVAINGNVVHNQLCVPYVVIA